MLEVGIFIVCIVGMVGNLLRIVIYLDGEKVLDERG